MDEVGVQEDRSDESPDLYVVFHETRVSVAECSQSVPFGGQKLTVSLDAADEKQGDENDDVDDSDIGREHAPVEGGTTGKLEHVEDAFLTRIMVEV